MRHLLVLSILLASLLHSAGAAPQKLSKNLTLIPGPVNGVLIKQKTSSLAIYGDPRPKPAEVSAVFFTHHRRDVVWAGRKQVDQGADAVVPEKERHYFEEPEKQWNDFIKIRLVDAQQQSTKMITKKWPVAHTVKGGEVKIWNGLRFDIIDTPGFTRDAVSYIATIDGQKIAFTGDAIYGDGQIFDLYSFQDKIPAARIGGYHGYGSRLAQLLESLQKIAAAKPDLIVPARGPVIRNVQASIDRLIKRIKALYRNYLSTNALFWYFKEDRMKACAERILGVGAKYELMPYSFHEELPEWVLNTGTTRIIISENGAAFMLDCGSKRYIDFVKDLMKQGLVKQVEGIFVTHYHGDHTHYVQAAAEEFGCPVYATEEYEDILENPGAWHMPAGTKNPIKNVIGHKDGTIMKWHEYEFTFRFFPGQTLLHGALLVRRPGEKSIFFVGDAFTPSGMDDYCVLNRNLLHEDTGYLRCFNIVREIEKKHGEIFLMNEHVPFIFKYTPEEMKRLETRYRERIAMLQELCPWDDPNYGIDEQWAWFYPYGVDTNPGQTIDFEFRFYNHSPKRRQMSLKPNLPEGFSLVSGKLKTIVAARAQATVPLRVKVSAGVRPGPHIITADVFSEGITLREWSEAIVTVADEQ